MKQIHLDYPAFNVVGQSLHRIDVVEKLTGRAVFAEDILPGAPVLHGRVLRSPHPHAVLKKLDVSAARAMPGVKAVITAEDFPRKLFGRYLVDERYMPAVGEKVLYVGDRVAAVAAETLEQAKAALAAIVVEYEVLEPLLDARKALEPGAQVLHPDLMTYKTSPMSSPAGGNIASTTTLERGDPEGALASAHQVFEETYDCEMVHQAYMEPHACLALYNPDNTYTVHATTQGQFPLRNTIAEVLDVPQNQVRVVPTEIGGGFGGKIAMLEEASACMLAKKSGMPVRIVHTREEDFIAAEPRSGFHIHIRTGVDAEGHMVARIMDVILDNGAFARAGVLTSTSVPTYAEGPYRIPNLRIRTRCVYTNKTCSASMRAPGGPQTNFALESETERIAHALGMDSIAFRRKNLMPEAHVSLAGVAMRNVNATETLDAALELSGYDSANTRKGPNRAMGLGLGNWNVGGMPSGAVLKLNDDGSASILTGVVDLTGVHTSLVQVVAEALALPPEQVTVKTLDTESAPHSTISAGSQALKSMGLAVLKAAEHVKAQLFELAVEDLDATPDRMELGDGQVRVRGEAGRAVAVPQLIARKMAKEGPVVGYGSTGNFDRLPGFACQVAEVEVDPDTGRVDLKRYIAAQDCGIAISPVIADGQVQGGAVQGIGMALMESLGYHADGQPQARGFLDYKMPSALDVPMIETVLVEKPAVDGPFGAKGIGEPPNVPGPATIANAIFHAVGVRITSLPITPEKVRAAIRAKQAGA